MTAAMTASLPGIGTTAPDFSLPSTSGEPVAVSDYLGKSHVLLAFFPAAFTGTCSREVCEFGEDYSQYQSAHTAVLPISVDALPSLKAFKKYEHVGIDMLSDFKRQASRAYGVLNDGEFRSRRAYILIDRDGIVRWTHVEADSSNKRSTAELIHQIAALA